MKCPMSAANPHVFDHGLMECDPDCMWRTEVFKNGESYGFTCAVSSAYISFAQKKVPDSIMYAVQLDREDEQ